MRNRKFLCSILALGMVASLTGCGKENVDVSANADVLFSGYNGHGTATVSEGSWLSDIEDQFGSDMSFGELAKLELALDDAVDFKLSNEEDLSNGDEVTLTIDVNNDVLDDYDFKLSGGEKKFTVSGLDEIEEFDPFENVSVSFSGMSPNGEATVNRSSSDSDLSLSYDLDKSSGLKNGDEVTLSISSSSGDDVEEYCLNHGKTPTATEKKFTVEGLASYAQTIEEIPEDSLNKMISQAEDSFKSDASSWDEGNTLKSSELLGYYFLTPKEGFSTDSGNILYCVFKETAELTAFENEEQAKVKDAEKKACTETYYTYYKYSDIILLEDGTCSFDLSSGSAPGNRIDSKCGYLSWGYFEHYGFNGYSDLDSMFNDCVTSKIDSYSYVNTVQ